MKFRIILLFIAFSCSVMAQTTAEKDRILYGSCTKDSLYIKPFVKWFDSGYKSYNPTTTVVTALKKQNFDNISIKIFFGSWCGDSKREVPRFLPFPFLNTNHS